MAEVVVPEIDDLYYHQHLVEDPKTMSFSKPISFGREKWEEFYKREVDRDPSEKFLAYIFCDACMDFTGEISYKYDENVGGFLSFILIDANHRRDGYGKEALRLLKIEASNNDIHKFYALLDKNNNDGKGFVEKMGYELIDDKDKLLYMLDF